MTVFWLSAGLLAGAAYVGWAARLPFAPARRYYALGLVVAAVIYVLFAIFSGAPVWLGIELGGVALFGALAWMGLRFSAAWLAIGWLVHPLWDGGLHLSGPGLGVAPLWYVLACLSFDLLVAAAIFVRIARAGHEARG